MTTVNGGYVRVWLGEREIVHTEGYEINTDHQLARGLVGAVVFTTISDAIEAAKPGDTAYVDSNGGDQMRWRKMLDHTRMRFNSMTERQLWNRMGATTTRDKLEAFAFVAEERNMVGLAAAARGKLEELHGVKMAINKTKSDSLRKSEDGRLLRRMDL